MGASHLEVKMGNVADMVSAHDHLANLVSSFEQQYGKDASARIVTDWIFDARDRRGFSFLEISVLIAIYSKIGRKRGAVLITNDEIWRRSHGCKSKAVFAAVSETLPLRWSKNQVKSAVHRLFGRHCFSRVTFGRRHTYYSNRLTQTKLEDSVVQKKTVAYAGSRREQDANKRVDTRVYQERLRILAGPPL
jgi:hypothetical protein